MKGKPLLVFVSIWSGIGSSNALGQPASRPADAIRVMRAQEGPSIVAFWKTLAEGPPSLRGYQAPILGNADRRWPPHPGETLEQNLQLSSEIIGRRLARDGLLATLTQVLEVMGWRWVATEQAKTEEILRSIGFPVDLLRFFLPEGQESTEPYMVIVDITRMFGGDATAAEIIPELRSRSFRFMKSRPDFQLATDSGEHDIGLLRLQIAGGGYFQGPGDGGSIDLTRQLLAKLPNTPILAHIEEKHVEPFLKVAGTWPNLGAGRMTLLAEQLPVSQWAQDNGKAGLVGADSEGAAATAMIVPRYASRRDEITSFVPGENHLLNNLAGAGIAIFQSPLLFQGGNLIAVREPKTGQRTLLVGEAEVYRNVALGLSVAEVLEAFRAEFGVDRCVVLPAISYHIDYELTVRVVGDEVVACVNDSDAASREVLLAGLTALEQHGQIDQAAARRSREALANRQMDVALEVVENVLVKNSVEYGKFPESFADVFAAGPSDSGIGNLQRFLLAVDTIAFSGSKPHWASADPHGAAYANSLKRRERDRAEVSGALSRLGWRVERIPSTSEGNRSLNYINGVHTPNSYLMPAYGGLYSGLDTAAQQSLERAWGPRVRVEPVYCGESQRRMGAVRCSVSAIPAVR